MEGKTVILSFLIMSLVIAQNQVEAGKGVCCPSTAAIAKYHLCRVRKHSPSCIKENGCIYVTGQPTCPPGYPYATILFVISGDTVNEYCKLGCAYSVCGALTILQDYDANEIVNGAVAQCTNACANFCTKGSANAVETA